MYNFSMKINMNKLAVAVAEKEGKKHSLSIAQVKEVLHIAVAQLKKFKPSEVLELLERE